MNGQIF